MYDTYICCTNPSGDCQIHWSSNACIMVLFIECGFQYHLQNFLLYEKKVSYSNFFVKTMLSQFYWSWTDITSETRSTHPKMDLSHPVTYFTIHHSEQKSAHFCSEWCIVVYETGALWDGGQKPCAICESIYASVFRTMESITGIVMGNIL